MSAARPVARRLLSQQLASPASLRTPSSPSTSRFALTCSHQFHSSSQLRARWRGPGYRSKKRAHGLQTTAEEMFPARTAEDVAEFRARYNVEQMRAIEAGDEAVDTQELANSGRLRLDTYAMPYLDDFSTIQPIIDKRAKRAPPPDPNARFMSLDEFTMDLIDWADKLRNGKVTNTLKKLNDFVAAQHKGQPESQWPEEVKAKAWADYETYMKELVIEDSDNGPTDADILSYVLERSSMTDGNRPSNSEMAPGLPSQVPGVAGRYKAAIDPEDDGLDDEGVYQTLKARTGMSVREILSITIYRFKPRWVANQTRLGKIRSYSVTCVAGNRNGWIGLGQAKSTEPSVANQQAMLEAIQNMRPIRRYEDRTIYGNVESKISGTIVRLFSRPPGMLLYSWIRDC